MAMLAGPRRKVKLSKDPNNLNWSNDEDKFGQRMLERMGWQKGKGLGANENGRVDHIAVKLKSDNTGVGCTKSHADNWIAHQDDFGALLANLNANHSNTNSGTNTPDAEKVISLESHSKSAKGRVHYKKFTRSKDLSAKNAEDMNCVFGRRKSKSTINMKSEDKIAINDPASGSDTDNNYGVTTTTSKQSVQEYFAQKMAELKRSRVKETGSPEKGNVAVNDFDNMFGAGGSGVSCELGVRYEDVEDDYERSFSDRPQAGVQNEVVVESKSERRTKIKRGVDKGGVVTERDEDVAESLECEVEPSKKRRKKKVDKGRDVTEGARDVVESLECDVESTKKKKKVADGGGDEGSGDLGKSFKCEVEPSKKKRKKKIDQGGDVKEGARDVVESLECDVEPSKKKKKEKVDDGVDVTKGAGDLGGSLECDVEPSKTKRKKSKKSRKSTDEGATCDVTVETEKGCIVGKKSKREKRKLNVKESVSDENVEGRDVEKDSVDAVNTGVDADVGCADEGKAKKKKKKKNGKKDALEAVEEIASAEVVMKESVQKTKKRKGKAVESADVKKDKGKESSPKKAN